MIIQQDIDKIFYALDDIITKFTGKTALVTGGVGFIGSYLCESLLRCGAKVICVDNLSSGTISNIAHLRTNPSFKFVEHDVSQPMDYNGVDLIFHFASMNAPAEFEHFGIEIIKANVDGTYNMLELARTNDAPIIFSSSSETYGEPTVVPTPETCLGQVNSIGVRGPYDESKRCGEALCFAFRRRYGTKIKVVRIFNTYGPRQRWTDPHGKVVAKFIANALKNQPIEIFGTGEQTRSFLYINDCVSAVLRMIADEKTDGKVVNIGSIVEISMKHLVETVISTLGSSSKLEFRPLPRDEPSRRCPDISNAKALLNLKQTVGLIEGIRRTARWFKEMEGEA